MTTETKNYCREAAPFRAARNMDITWDWSVLAANSETLLVTDEEDVARTVADALNHCAALNTTPAGHAGAGRTAALPHNPPGPTERRARRRLVTLGPFNRKERREHKGQKPKTK